MTTKIADLIPDNKNANKGSRKGRKLVKQSIENYGTGRSVLADKNGRLIAGNKATEAALAAGLTEAVIVETTGDQLVVVKRMDLDLDDPKARALAVADNATGQFLEWDFDVLADFDKQGINLDYLFETEDDPDPVLDPPVVNLAVPNPLDSLDNLEATEDNPVNPEFNVKFASNNEWDIPTLDLKMQATGFDLPIRVWGNQNRKLRFTGGTLVFYVDDYRFNAIWQKPEQVVNSGIKTAVEANFSIFGDSPRADALYQVFRKRYLARYWQSCGIRIVVDLNVGGHEDLNLLGVPDGWRAYSSRGGNSPDTLDMQWGLARDRAGTDEILFMVYGGGKATKEYCGKRGWVWVPEIMGAINNG